MLTDSTGMKNQNSNFRSSLHISRLANDAFTNLMTVKKIILHKYLEIWVGHQLRAVLAFEGLGGQRQYGLIGDDHIIYVCV